MDDESTPRRVPPAVPPRPAPTPAEEDLGHDERRPSADSARLRQREALGDDDDRDDKAADESADDTDEPKKKKGFWANVRSFVVIILVMFAMRSSLLDWNDVPTGSMLPTILVGDRVLVNKLAYGLKIPFTNRHIWRWGQPKRGEIVVFFQPREADRQQGGKGTRLIKRVIGLPGDLVEIRNHRLYVNGVASTYEPWPIHKFPLLTTSEVKSHDALIERLTGFGAHAVLWLNTSPNQRIDERMMNFQVRVPAGQYLMMGDNRDQSLDSRFWGTVPVDLIAGRATRVAFSLDHENWYMPRWKRFFAPIYGPDAAGGAEVKPGGADVPSK